MWLTVVALSWHLQFGVLSSLTTQIQQLAIEITSSRVAISWASSVGVRPTIRWSMSTTMALAATQPILSTTSLFE